MDEVQSLSAPRQRTPYQRIVTRGTRFGTGGAHAAQFGVIIVNPVLVTAAASPLHRDAQAATAQVLHPVAQNIIDEILCRWLLIRCAATRVSLPLRRRVSACASATDQFSLGFAFLIRSHERGNRGPRQSIDIWEML